MSFFTRKKIEDIFRDRQSEYDIEREIEKECRDVPRRTISDQVRAVSSGWRRAEDAADEIAREQSRINRRREEERQEEEMMERAYYRQMEEGSWGPDGW